MQDLWCARLHQGAIQDRKINQKPAYILEMNTRKEWGFLLELALFLRKNPFSLDLVLFPWLAQKMILWRLLFEGRLPLGVLHRPCHKEKAFPDQLYRLFLLGFPTAQS